MITKLIEIGIFIAIYVIVVILCWLFTEKVHIKPFTPFYFYPWICLKCLTTQVLLFSYIFASYLLSSWFLLVVGVIASIGTGIGLYIIEKEMMTESVEEEVNNMFNKIKNKLNKNG